MMKTLIYLNLVLCLFLCLAGCKESTPDTSPNQPGAEPAVLDANEPAQAEVSTSGDKDTMTMPGDKDTMTIVGKVVYKDLEGGFFAIDADDGKKYNPLGLPQDYRKDGLRVKVKARIKPNAMSIHMYGAIIEIVDITTP